MTDLNATSEAPAAGDPALSQRIRTSLAVAQNRISSVPSLARARLTAQIPGQITALPDQIRDAVDKALDGARDRLRTSLDLPSRDELSALLERVEALDAKLSALETDGAKKPTRKKPASKATAAKTKKKSVDKNARLAAIEKAAKKKPAGKAKKSTAASRKKK